MVLRVLPPTQLRYSNLDTGVIAAGPLAEYHQLKNEVLTLLGILLLFWRHYYW